MQFHSHANQSRFHRNGFSLRLALKKRHKGTRKWPIPLKPPICVSIQTRTRFTLHMSPDRLLVKHHAEKT